MTFFKNRVLIQNLYNAPQKLLNKPWTSLNCNKFSCIIISFYYRKKFAFNGLWGLFQNFFIKQPSGGYRGVLKLKNGE